MRTQGLELYLLGVQIYWFDGEGIATSISIHNATWNFILVDMQNENYIVGYT